ncbi:MAG: hypothetical protein J0665_12000, partial [Deltaproteobacteria bacterium]|nr:hypothetical protein [Deltaproteobacteria bacterium]
RNNFKRPRKCLFQVAGDRTTPMPELSGENDSSHPLKKRVSRLSATTSAPKSRMRLNAPSGGKVLREYLTNRCTW